MKSSINITFTPSVSKVDAKNTADTIFDFIKGFTDQANCSFWDDTPDFELAKNGCAIISGYMDDWDVARISAQKDIAKNVRAWVDDLVKDAKNIAGESTPNKLSYEVAIHDHVGCGGMSIICTDVDEGAEYDKLMIIPIEK